MDGFWVVVMKSSARGQRLGPNTTDVKKDEFERMGEFVGRRLRDLNQIFHFQRQTQDCSWRNRWNFRRVYYVLMTRDRKFARAGQTHKKWKADSSSMEHAPQVELGLHSNEKLRVFATEAFRSVKSTEISNYSTEVSVGTHETFESISRSPKFRFF
jgi:hypothetical protein